MTRKCFLVEDGNPDAEGLVELSPTMAHHVRHVLRLRPGQRIELRDGRGGGWSGVIREMNRQGIRVAVGEKDAVGRESSLNLTVALAFSRSERMELVLRQATEMGVHGFIAFVAERSDYHLSKSQMERRMDRWRKITGEALCQCARMRLPELLALHDVGGLIAHAVGRDTTEGEALKVLAKEEGDRQSLSSLFERYPSCLRMLVVVGPEGGWSKREIEQFAEAGFYTVHLGPRTLRLETAAVALLAAAQLLWGDLGVGRE